MNLLDLAILIIVIYLIVRGFFRGIVQEAALLVGLIVSFFLASFYYKELGAWLGRFLPNHEILLSFFCFVLLFFIFLLLFNFFGIMAKKAASLALLGWLDRALGAFFGLIKGAVIIFILVTILTVFYPKSGFMVENSRFFPSILTVTERLTSFIPFKIKEDFQTKKRALQDFWEGKKQNLKKMQRPLGDV
jgi:membrane protein required for colicin V production